MFKLGMKSNAYVAMAKPFDVNPLMTSRIFFECPKCLHVLFQSTSSWLKLPWFKFLVALKMSDVLVLCHFANPSCTTNLLPTWVWWSKCFPKSFAHCINFRM